MLARNGVSVVLFERSRYDNERIGETVPPEIRISLQRLGIWDLFAVAGHRSVAGISCFWGSDQRSENDFIFNPYGNGWVLDRRRFDSMLANAAEAAGVSVRCSAEVGFCERKSTHSWSVRARCNGKKTDVGVRFILNATGRMGTIPGLSLGRVYADKTIALSKRFQPINGMCPDRRTLIEASQHGWWYSTWLPSNEFLAVYMTDMANVGRTIAQRERAWKESLTATPHTFERLMCCPPSSRLRVAHAGCSRSRHVGGSDWFSIGDAAIALDPLCGHGILRALHSGIAGADIVVRTLTERMPSAGGIEVSEAFAAHLKLRAAYYRVEQRWRDSCFWARRRGDNPLANGRALLAA